MVATPPDAERKLKVSLLDSLSELRLPADAWFNVGQTAPSGDFSKARIEARGRGHESLGQIEMLIGRRNYAYYFTDDPVISEIHSNAATASAPVAPAQEAPAEEAATEAKSAT